MNPGIYVHVPYCRRRCSYCDFYFEVRAADPAFVDAVWAELDARKNELGGDAPSLSLGGGTPTALAPTELARLLDGLRARVGLAAGAEVSLEVNPEDTTPQSAHALKAAGFTRASVGIQSFDDDVLKLLGRVHTGAEARAAVEALVVAGLDVGVDLIIGVPGEAPDRLARDVAQCASLNVVHVSTYLLTVEAGTPLERLVQVGRRAPVDDDAQADAYLLAQTLLADAGFAQYEISSHARPGKQSRHNRLYWAHAPYLGLGPGAHSMRLLPDGGVLRRHNSARLEAWLPDPTRAAHDDETLGPPHAFVEGVAFGLRDLEGGVSLQRLAALHQVPVPDAVRAALQRAEQRGEVQQRDGVFLLTPLGARFADRVARDVLTSDVLASGARQR